VARDLSRRVLRVLDRHGDAQQRPLLARAAAGVGLVGVRQRALGHDDPEGVQLWLEQLDSLEVELDQLARRDLAGANQLRLPGDPREGQIVHDP
jgi:hypothetical protein